MTLPDRNEGVIVSGGTLNADVRAVGRRAQAIKNVTSSADTLAAGGRDEVADRLRALIAAIEAHADELGEPDELARSTETVAHELESEKPNTLTVRAVLDGLARAAGPVTAVAQAATALQAAVAAIL
jgi:hypothetical protein